MALERTNAFSFSVLIWMGSGGGGGVVVGGELCSYVISSLLTLPVGSTVLSKPLSFRFKDSCFVLNTISVESKLLSRRTKRHF